ncbi:PEP-CTERM sorting domain-containing protein [Neiella marina]|uniref:PEP-CTERM sorting domain-containing protein n=1 Tax=Neiella holothuriorum TaxID=2870530 RepID=A0ABS7ECH4_9GAMM|nr:PEP-CTERM sorting domain-containing protein [Neiella holothuriorum]MBW8189920.1 PEP-CTERM sorting domain-containing protein [Neiella holothuriorum]
MLRKMKGLFIALAILPSLFATTALAGFIEETYSYSDQGGVAYDLGHAGELADKTASTQINVDDIGIITNVTVSVTFAHDWVGDLIFMLTGPDSSVDPIILLSRAWVDEENFPDDCCGPGATSGPVTFEFDDAAGHAAEDTYGFTGAYSPTELLENFDGSAMTGDWTLSITDVLVGGDDVEPMIGKLSEGLVYDWSLTIQYEQIPLPSSILLMGLGLLALRVAKRR